MAEPGKNNRGQPARYEWMPSGSRLDTRHVDGPWICDCHSYGLQPKPNSIGMCVTCYRPVYDVTTGERVTGEHVAETPA